jgi:hypothetical protein
MEAGAEPALPALAREQGVRCLPQLLKLHASARIAFLGK